MKVLLSFYNRSVFVKFFILEVVDSVVHAVVVSVATTARLLFAVIVKGNLVTIFSFLRPLLFLRTKSQQMVFKSKMQKKVGVCILFDKNTLYLELVPKESKSQFMQELEPLQALNVISSISTPSLSRKSMISWSFFRIKEKSQLFSKKFVQILQNFIKSAFLKFTGIF